MNIVCVGDCGIDCYLPSGEKHIGGITANVSRHARDQFPTTDEVVVVSCLGDDQDAERVRTAFRGTSIECLWASRPGATPVQYIEVQPDGERRFVGYEAGVLPDLEFTQAQRAAIRSSDLLIAPVYEQIVDLFNRLMAVGTRGKVAIDFADFLEHPDFGLVEAHADRIDVAFFGLSPDRSAEIERIAGLARACNGLFVVTLGAAGSIAFDREFAHECPIERTGVVVDTTGAGDAYAATFLAHYVHGADIPESMRQAARIAARVVAGSGGYPA
jgi:sugar/nucleoside kinase (ribokinase family)